MQWFEIMIYDIVIYVSMYEYIEWVIDWHSDYGQLILELLSQLKSFTFAGRLQQQVHDISQQWQAPACAYFLPSCLTL